MAHRLEQTIQIQILEVEKMNSWVEYNTLLFTDVWDEAQKFVKDYRASGIPTTISDANAMTLYYLLYARYGNTPISAMDEYQWKTRVFSIIFQYGPTWEKKLEIQKAVRTLTINDLKKGATTIYNKALNPASAPSDQTLEEINYINEQNVSKVQKNDSQAYAEWMSLLEEDVTGYFLRKFDGCFKKIVRPEKTLEYVTEDDYEA